MGRLSFWLTYYSAHKDSQLILLWQKGTEKEEKEKADMMQYGNKNLVVIKDLKPI